MVDNNEYFQRQISLWGEQTQKKLYKKKIAIIGCGGLGSTLGITLGSSGIGEIHLVDFDTVSVHNIHRQIAYTIEDEGKYKCEQLSKLLTRRYDRLTVHTYTESFADFTTRGVDVDLIIDATDNLGTREQIDKYAKQIGTPWVYGTVESFHGLVCFFDKSPFQVYKITDRKPGGIAAPIVSFIASLQANFALRYLAGLEVEKDEVNYLYFDESGSLHHKKFQMITK